MLRIISVFILIASTDGYSEGVAPLLKLNDGASIPALGLGTWLGFTENGWVFVAPKGDEIQKAVEWAIDAGYRHIDTAYIYNIEDQVGRALKKKIAEGVVKREDVFIVTKLWNDKHAKDDVVPTLRKSLRNLDLDYVDQYLIHSPVSLHPNGTVSNVDYMDTWQGMIEAKAQGLTRSIGVSNFDQQQLQRLVTLSPVKPAVLQVQINLNLQQPALMAYCRSQDIKVIAFTPFGSMFYNRARPGAPPPRADDQNLLKIAEKYNKTVPQVVLRYLVELGVIPIPKSVTKVRIEQNIQVFDFTLTEAEKELLRGFDRDYNTFPEDGYSEGVAPLLKLNDGASIPALGLGTWLGLTENGDLVASRGDEIQKAVEWAIDAGYRHIDTAYIYNIEDQVGRALKKKIAEGVVKREDIFIVTKLTNEKHAKDDVVPALRESLRNLDLDYVDQYLIHTPVSLHPNGTVSNVDYMDTWQGMIEAKAQGLTRSIGVSNFDQQQLERLVTLSPVKPAVLQVQINLNLQQPALMAYCRSQDIKVIAFTPFGSLFYSKARPGAPPPRVDDQNLLKIAEKYNKTVPQVVLRYLVELGVIPIPKSVTKARIEQNIQVFDFTLTEVEKELLRSFDRDYSTFPELNFEELMQQSLRTPPSNN